MSNEVELKFLIAQQLVSVYYDTPAFDLRKNRTALRLRRMGDRWIQTVKTEGKVAGGLHERPEWECETAENTLDFDAIPNPTVREFFADEKIHWALRPVFVTYQLALSQARHRREDRPERRTPLPPNI